MYYSRNDLLSYNALFNFVVGSRGTGKTYSFKDWAINDFLKKSSDLVKLKHELETFIHAIELDESELDVCKARCDEVASKYGIMRYPTAGGGKV